MVIKYFGPNDKTGVVWPPYTTADRRYMDGLRKWATGPIVMVGPDPATRTTNRRTATKTRSAEEAADRL